jgi:cell shape-determining protein MreC
MLSRKLRQVQNELDFIKGDIKKVELPAGLKGRVVAVDPKYEFVVLDIGQEQGVLERGEMLVNRSGRLVAKVRILSVHQTRSVANVLPDWKQGEILEGDFVIVGL